MVKRVGWKLQKRDIDGSGSRLETTLDALPDCIINKIFSLVSFKEGLPVFTILASQSSSLRELVLEGCTLMPCHNSLRKLSLTKVTLDQNMFHSLLSSCRASIVSFVFQYCSGLDKIELLNLPNIKSVSISTRTRDELRVKIRAPTLEHLSYSGYLSYHCLDVDDECHNVKSLYLSYMLTSNKCVQHLISRFQSLKVLRIRYCMSIAEINSPNLESFEYMGDQIPKLKIARKLKHSEIVLHCYDYLNLNDAWFCTLRKFLSNSKSWSQVSLYFPNCNEKINMKALQQCIVANPEVNVLNVDILYYQSQSEECPTFVDALLWSCHPRRLNLHSNVKTITCFIRRLMYMKNSCPSLSQLVKIEAFDGKNQPLRGRELEISSTLTERKDVYFLLDWRCS